MGIGEIWALVTQLFFYPPFLLPWTKCVIIIVLQLERAVVCFSCRGWEIVDIFKEPDDYTGRKCFQLLQLMADHFEWLELKEDLMRSTQDTKHVVESNVSELATVQVQKERRWLTTRKGN